MVIKVRFPVIFVPGVGYLPHPYGDIPDEAQLLYVAMMRAIEGLVLCCVFPHGSVRFKQRGQKLIRATSNRTYPRDESV